MDNSQQYGTSQRLVQEESKEPQMSAEEKLFRIKQKLARAIVIGAFDTIKELLEN